MSYGYNLWEFQGDQDIEAYKCFILDANHFAPATCPLYYQSLGQHLFLHPYHLGYDNVSSPTARGQAWRSLHGYCYITADITSEEERKAREPKFRQRMGTYIADPWAPWNEWKTELKSHYDKYMPMNVEHMGDGELGSHLWDMWNLNRRMWEIHFLGFELYSSGLGVFRDLAADLIGLHYTDPLYATLMSGFDNSLFQLNKGLADLAAKALDLKLENVFKLPEEEVLPAMAQSDVGSQWLEAFNFFLHEDGFRGQGWRMQRMLEYATPTWFEKPHLIVPDIRRLMTIGGDHAPDLKREQLIRDRKTAEKEVLAKVPVDHREWFELMMRFAQADMFYCEDHDYWCEFRTFSLVRRAALEAGKRMVTAGLLEDPEDVFMLLIEQIIGGVTGRSRSASLVKPALKSNKEEWTVNVNRPYPSEEVPMFLGDPSWVPKLVAASPQLNVEVSPQLAKPEEVGALCVGAAGAPGIVEGIARIIKNEREWDLLQPGEILVCSTTMATWTPLFSTVKAVVTDTGGMLSHPIIVSREYGIPAVTGTIEATRKIKTGDRIKVDGNLCRVYKLE